MKIEQQMILMFEQVFDKGEEPDIYFAPGRVNLIGEHTDYNGGHVFPCALTIGTYAAVRKRTDQKIRFYSENFSKDGCITLDLSQIANAKVTEWIRYPVGVCVCLKQEGYEFPFGFDILFYGTIPNGSGLSSSASIEVLMGYILCDLYQIKKSRIDLALLAQRAENEYVGMKCGIMDQFAIAMGRESQAIFLDTNTLSFEYCPINLGDYTFVIVCSNKKRGLADSKYNERRSECEQALLELQKVCNVTSLGEMTSEQFEAHHDAISSELLRKRARHAVTENQRTIQAVKALKEEDLVQFGKLMKASHESLRDDYEVTGKELDTIYMEGKELEGVLGTRMTGAGFGGCAVSLVRKDCVDHYIEVLSEKYLALIGYKADFYPVLIGDGPQKM